MEAIKEIAENLYEKTMRTFNDGEFSKIKLLKLIFRYILDTQSSVNPALCHISNEIKENIVNSLIMAYIEIWLENDESNKQSIDSYVKNIFQMQSQIKPPAEDDATITPNQDLCDVIRREMYNGECLMRANIYMQNTYSEQQNFVHKEMLPKQSYRNKYSLLELEGFFKAGVEPLHIYKDIFKNKKPYQTTNRNSTSLRTNIIEQDIDDYNQYLYHIKSLINEKDTCEGNSKEATKNNKEFVVKCLFVWKHERTYRYRLTAMLAKYLSDNSDSINPIYIPDTIKCYCSMYPNDLLGDKTKCSLSYFIKYYDEIIRHGYSNMDAIAQAAVEIARACFDICFTIMCRTFHSVTLLGPWDDNDFEDVARFMIYEYGIKECLEMPDMEVVTHGNESPYTIIKKLFELPDYMNANQITYYKENLKAAKKRKIQLTPKRNPRHTDD